MDLKSLSDDVLLKQTSKVVESERRITADAIRHFYEINKLKLYLKMGYGSLFEMLRDHFGYCPATAQLRKNAVFLMQDVPVVLEKIESGEMPVSVAADIQSFLYQEKMRHGQGYTPEAKLELVETCTGKSVLDVRREFVRRNPEIEKRESIRQTSEDRVRVSHASSNELEEKLKRIKLLWSHIDPNMSREQLLDRMAELTLDQLDPLRKAERAEKRKQKIDAKRPEKLDMSESTKPAVETVTDSTVDRSTAPIDVSMPLLRVSEVAEQAAGSEPVRSAGAPNPRRISEVTDQLDVTTQPKTPRSRYIAAEADRAVGLQNANQGCEFVSPVTNKRCGSKFQLQRDHIKPFSYGGSNDARNLRILCAAHNRGRDGATLRVRCPERAYA